MNLIGNKIFTTLLLTGSVLSAAVQAESPVDNSEEIKLTTFSANTPAKAADVNGNFEALQNQIVVLQEELKALRTAIPQQPEFSVAVYGDGVLIGHTRPLPALGRAPLIELINSKEQYRFSEEVNGKYIYIRSEVIHFIRNVSELTIETSTGPIGSGSTFLDSECLTHPVITAPLSFETWAYDPNYEISEDLYFVDNDDNYFKAVAGSKPNKADKVYISSSVIGNPNPNSPRCSTLEFTDQVIFRLQPIDKSEITLEFSSITVEGYVHPE